MDYGRVCTLEHWRCFVSISDANHLWAKTCDDTDTRVERGQCARTCSAKPRCYCYLWNLYATRRATNLISKQPQWELYEAIHSVGKRNGRTSIRRAIAAAILDIAICCPCNRSRTAHRAFMQHLRATLHCILALQCLVRCHLSVAIHSSANDVWWKWEQSCFVKAAFFLISLPSLLFFNTLVFIFIDFCCPNTYLLVVAYSDMCASTYLCYVAYLIFAAIAPLITAIQQQRR